MSELHNHLLFPLCLLLASRLASASAPSAVGRMETLLSVQDDGSAVVIENLELLPRDVERVWKIPTLRANARGEDRYLDIKVLSVQDAQSNPIEYSERDFDDHIELRLRGGPAKLTYLVRNATDFRSDRDDLFWSHGIGSHGPVASLQLSVKLPDRAAGQFRAQAFLFSPGNVLQLPVQIDGALVQIHSPQPLNPPDDFGMDITLPSGVLQRPDPLTRAAWLLGANPVVLLPILVGTVLLIVWRLKRPAGAVSIAPRYEPPEGLTPAEIGVLIDDSLDPRDITATLIDLAVRGYIRIEQGTPDEGIHFPGQDFILRLLKPREQWSQLPGHESVMLFHTFYGGHWTKLSSLTLRFYDVVPIIRCEVMSSLERRGYYRFDPALAPPLRFASVVAAVVLLLLMANSGVFVLGNSDMLTWGCFVLSAALVFFFSPKISPKTLRGLRAYAGVRGFQEFLNSVERDRLERFPADIFEKYLPYAMALNVENHWTHAFEGMALPPTWSDAFSMESFDPAHFIDRLLGFTNAAHRAILAVPRAAAPASRPTSPLAQLNRSGWAVRPADIDQKTDASVRIPD